MKIFSLKIWLVVALGGMVGMVPGGLPAQEVSVGVSIHATADFEAPLAAHGGWVTVGGHGRCWHPNGLAADWRPYCVGDWVWTDCGWYWESAEPWAWACYHYGTWVEDPGFGWVWVPGIEWAPAWVVWRSGGGYIGWAPCAPAGVVVAPAWFAFVEVGRFHEHFSRSTVAINNTTIINKTTVINDIRREDRNIGGRQQHVVVNEGPGVAVVEKATGKKIDPVSVQVVDRRTAAPANLRPANRGNAAKETRPVEDRGTPPARNNNVPVRPEQNTVPTRPDQPEVVQPAQPRGGIQPEQPRENVAPPNRGNNLPNLPQREGNAPARPVQPVQPRDGSREERPVQPERGRGEGEAQPRPATPPREGGGGGQREGRGGGDGGMTSIPSPSLVYADCETFISIIQIL